VRRVFWRVRKVAQGWRATPGASCTATGSRRATGRAGAGPRLLEDLAPNANERENLYQHDMGVVRLRRVMRSAAQEQIEAEKARA
jgi:hypothetical protein